MRVYRPRFKRSKERGGASGTSSKWYIEVRDHQNIVRQVAAFADKAASQECGRKIERLIAQRLAGESPDTALTKWLEVAPASMRESLARWGVIEASRHAAGKPLAEHIEEWKQSLQARERTPKHVGLIAGRAEALMEACAFHHWSDIRAAAVERALTRMRSEGIGVRTAGFYLASLKSFCRWMVSERRASESPIAHLKGGNAEADRRRTRRALSETQLRDLIAAAQSGPEWRGIPGPERALVYRLAMETALRAGEIASLTRASFKLDGDEPTVTVKASDAKNRRECALPLRSDTAELLAAHLASKLPAANAFKLPAKDRFAAMLRRDLERAGIPYIDDAGDVCDFHSLRHSAISRMVRTGVDVRTAQAFARHSTPVLTLGVYSHVSRHDEARAVAALPSLDAQPATAMATGTDGRADALRNGTNPARRGESCAPVQHDARDGRMLADETVARPENCIPSCIPFSGENRGNTGSHGVNSNQCSDDQSAKSPSPANPLRTSESGRQSASDGRQRVVPRTGIEPVACGLGNRRSIQLSYRGVVSESVENLL